MLFAVCLIIAAQTMHGQAGVVGYSTKVFAEGPEKIKAGKQESEILAFPKEKIALSIPEGWKVIYPDSVHYNFIYSRGRLNLANERGDEVMLWESDINIGYYLDEKYIVNYLMSYAPNFEQIKTIHISGDGPDMILYIWKAYHIHDAEKKPFIIYTAYKEAPTFKPNIQNANLFGRSAGLDEDGRTEKEIIEMLKFFQTYIPYSKEWSKNQIDFPVYDMQDLEADPVTVDYKTEIKQDEEAIQDNLSLFSWPFQTKSLWVERVERVKEDSVLWKIPSIVNASNELKESVKISPRHLLLLSKEGVEMVDINDEKMLWYQDAGFSNCQLAAGNQEELILYRNTGHKLIALESMTGNVLWSADLDGGIPNDWLMDDDSGVLTAVQLDRKETHLTGVDVTSGEVSWNRVLDNSAGLTVPPLPEIIDNKIILYSDGVEVISAADGATVWTKEELRLEDRCPIPQMVGDTIILIGKDNKLHALNLLSGEEHFAVEVRKSAEYTNIFPSGNRIYIRGKLEDKSEPEPYFIDAMKKADGTLSWSYQDTVPSVSNLIDEGGIVYVSNWMGPVAIDGQTGRSLYNSVVSEVGETYPVSLLKYGDTLVYMGEMVIAGIDAGSGKVLYRNAFDPVSQTMNLDGIDKNGKEIIDYLKFYGKVGLEGTNLSGGNTDYFFNLSRASQEQASKYMSASMASHSMYLSTGESSYAFKSSMNYNSSLINSSFAKAYANVGMMMDIVPNMAAQVAEMTKPERDRYLRLMNSRKRLMDMYLVEQKGDYAFRIMEEPEKRNPALGVAIVYLPTGKIVYNRMNIRSLADIILDPEENLFYYHALRLVPGQNSTKDSAKNSALHGYYLVAEPLK